MMSFDQFLGECDRHLSFLVTGFAMQLAESQVLYYPGTRQGYGWQVCYESERAHLELYLEWREGVLNVLLSDPKSPDRQYDLLDIVSCRGGQPTPLGASRDSEIRHSMEQAAGWLQQYATDVLEGDFSIAPAIQAVQEARVAASRAELTNRRRGCLPVLLGTVLLVCAGLTQIRR